MTSKKINFGAGPAKLPEPVMERAQREFLNYHDTGIGIIEMSHRSADFMNLVNSTKKLLSDLMHIPSNYEVLFFQGGGSGQFAAIPLNLGAHSRHAGFVGADYAVTGAWSSKAVDEAAKFLTVRKVFDVQKPFTGPPAFDSWNRDPDAAYLYYCDNETVHGIEFHESPTTLPGVPLVADVSSNFLSRRFDFKDHGVVFGGAQKNLGAAGLTISIVREDLIGKEDKHTPAVFSFAEMHKNNSLYNTPSTYSIYLTKLVLDWIQDIGGVEEIIDRNEKKATLLYSTIDDSEGFYSNPVQKQFRSRMNVPFRIKGGDTTLEAEFVQQATARGMISLKGHRSVGGIRASIYNSVTLSETQTLVDFMNEFREKHA